jgi:short-subunit dehydrogenase
MLRRRQQLVAVITGASSGIGRATALEFSKRNISVVLASRRGHALNSVEEECRALGTEALVVVTDVTDEEAVRNLADKTFRRFGRLDVWVNDATVGLYGDFEHVPAKDFRRMIETDFFGYVNGTRAALPYFRRQGRGILVNVASVLGTFGIPHMSSYVAAKHAIVGFSDALRQELRGSGIRVCTILPASIDTPFYANAGNYTGREIRPVPPVFDPASVAVAIAEAVEDGREHVFVPATAAAIAVASAVWPQVTSRIARLIIDRFQISSRRTSHTPGNLYLPKSSTAKTAGGWKKSRRAVQWVTRGAMLGLASLLFQFSRRALTTSHTLSLG